jgi:hypothetical protein
LPRVDVEPFSPAEHRRSTRSKKENSAPLRNFCVTQPKCSTPNERESPPTVSDVTF